MPQEPAGMVGVFDRAARDYESVGVDYFGVFGRHLVEIAAIAAGERVLDVGCGRGAALFPAADRVGRSGEVVGIDLSPTMVSLTSDDAMSRGLDQVRVYVMDAQAPDIHEQFDVVMSSLVIFFLADPAAALRNWSDLLVENGRLAISTFGSPSDPRWDWIAPTMLSFAGKDAVVVGGIGAREPGRSGPFESTQSVEDLINANGFTDATSVVRRHETRFVDADQWLAWSWSHGGRGSWERVPEARRPEAEQLFRDRLAEMTEPDGSITLIQPLRYTVARKSTAREANT
jgi:SAM-dependent methyltransferase